MILSSLKSAIPWSDKRTILSNSKNAVLLHFLHHVAQQPVHFPDRLIHLFRLTAIGVPAAIYKTEIERAEIGIYLPGRIHPDRHTVDPGPIGNRPRSEEHTSELQSRGHLVCRLPLEKKKRTEKEQHQNYNEK